MKTLTFATRAHLVALSSDIEGRDENRRDDMRSVELEADDQTLIGMGVAIEWLRSFEGAHFPLVLSLAACPQIGVDEIEIALEQVTDAGLWDEEGDELSAIEVTEDATHVDFLGHDLYPADWSAMIAQQAGRETLRVADALAEAAKACRRVRDLCASPDTKAHWTDVCGVIEGLRAQRGCEHLDPAIEADGFLTHYADVAIFG